MEYILIMLRLDPLTAFFTIILGILLLIAGKLIIKTITGLVFGAGISIFTFRILSLLNISSSMILVLSSIVFIIGYLVGWFLIKFFISITTGFALGVVLTHLLNLQNTLLYSVIIILICIIICYLLAEIAITMVSAILGIILVIIGFENLFHKPMLTVVSVVLLLVLILYYKTKH